MKVTEKQLKSRATELNLGDLKTTTFGIKVERSSKGYSVSLLYRNGTPEETLLEDATASEAHACIEGIATTHRVFRASMLGSTSKPEFATDEMFLKQAGERCPVTKCGSKDISLGWINIDKGVARQQCRCQRCEFQWQAIYSLEGYEIINQTAPE